MDKNNIDVQTMNRMKQVRLKLIKEYPFFGELFMNLKLAVAKVGTACTDGSHMVMDPKFVAKLTDEEIQFVYMHEIMHCVLHHCYRRQGRNKLLWNLACDYVVNSNIVTAMGVSEFTVDGEPVFHLINGKEACCYAADEIYEMFPKDLDEAAGFMFGICQRFDSHEIWDEIEDEYVQDIMDQWEKESLDATSKWYGSGAGIAAGCLKRYKDACYKAQLKWKQIVRDFIRHRNQSEDYGFRPPDRRFAEEEFIYPGLNPEESEVVEEIWFCIDKSGSISRKMLFEIIYEIEGGLKQVPNMRGMVSFFDVTVSKPIPIKGLREFLKVGVPLPCGGTSFDCMFQYAVANRRKFKPKGIIILTDGCAMFPKKNPLPDVPVLWIIVDNPQVKPTFGKCAYLDSSLSKKEK